MEIWKSIPSYPKYEASSFGNIRRVGSTHKMAQRLVHCASVTYKKINVGWDNFKKQMVSQWVHILVCEAFNGLKPQQGWEVRHLDGNGQNNRSDNLKWGSKAMNLYDRFRYGSLGNPGPCECGDPFEDHNEDGQRITPGPECVGYRRAKQAV